MERMTGRADKLKHVPRGISTLGDDVHQLIGNDDDLDDLLAIHERLDLVVAQRVLLDDGFFGAERNAQAASQLAVDLHRDFGFVLLRQLRIESRPGLAEDRAGAAQLVPYLLRQIRREWREQQRQLFQDLSKRGAGEI